MDNLETKPIVIVGASDFGREVAGLIDNINEIQTQWDFKGFIDDFLKGETVEGFKILGPIAFLKELNPKPWVVIAIANPGVRKKIASELKDSGFQFATLIHPSVIISDHLIAGAGSIICAGSIFAINTQVGEHCIVNLGCRIGHDTILKDYVSLMPGTNLAGNVKIEEGCYFGLNTCVIHQKNVGAWSTIGAGAAVVSDIPSGVTAVGVPARVIKRNDQPLE